MTTATKPTIDRNALRQEAADQLEAYRQEAAFFMQRYGAGAARWAERGWTWQPPADWTTDPETWPPLAKLLYLYLRGDALITRANMLRTFRERPHYCPQCGDRPTSHHQQWDCPAHTDWALHVQRLAADLFGATS